MKNVVVIGGGKGQSSLLRGLKNINDVNLSAIVTVADDGGSTGRLREDFDVPAMGDVRNVLLALAGSESILNEMINHRFETSHQSDLSGHSLGNLILTAMTQITGDFSKAIASLSEILNVEGVVIPSSPVGTTLVAEMKDGTIVRGESHIPKYQNHIKKVYYDDYVIANQTAIKAIEEADIIVFGVGSVYTSILPNVIIPEIKNVLQNTTAKKVYYCNAMTQPGETDGFSVEDHVEAIEDHLGSTIDVVVLSDDDIPKEILKEYTKEQSYPVKLTHRTHSYQIIQQTLLDYKDGVIRHNHELVEKGFKEIMEAILCRSVVK